VLWTFFVANLYVTLVLLSGGAFPVMNMVACVVLLASLTINYSLFDRKGSLREETAGTGRPDVVVPDNMGHRVYHHPDLERFDGKPHRGSGITAGRDSDDVLHAQTLGDSDSAEEAEPGNRKAVD
jgi:hypothetical protein